MMSSSNVIPAERLFWDSLIGFDSFGDHVDWFGFCS